VNHAHRKKNEVERGHSKKQAKVAS
jgi:hypothetical protein